MGISSPGLSDPLGITSSVPPTLEGTSLDAAKFAFAFRMPAPLRLSDPLPARLEGVGLEEAVPALRLNLDVVLMLAGLRSPPFAPSE